MWKGLTFAMAMLALSLFAQNSVAAKVTLTIDDLPYVGNTKQDPGKLRRERKRFLQVLATLKEYHIPASGFVVANSIEPGQWELLEQFHQAGNIIANHSYSHMNLNSHSASQFMNDVQKAGTILQPLMSDPKYFRYPFLATGRNCQTYLQVQDDLKQQGYVIVPVTIDSKDFKLNYRLHAIPWRQRKSYLPSFKRRYLNATWASAKKAQAKTMKVMHRPVTQIMLIHMNTLNAYFLGDLIHMMQKHGYQFVSLPEAMSDPYYQKLAARDRRYQEKRCHSATN